MTCRQCHFEHPAWERCEISARKRERADVVCNPPVIFVEVCNQCVTKDEEINRLRNQIESMTPKTAKRDRAEYMRNYRKKS